MNKLYAFFVLVFFGIIGYAEEFSVYPIEIAVTLHGVSFREDAYGNEPRSLAISDKITYAIANGTGTVLFFSKDGIKTGFCRSDISYSNDFKIIDIGLIQYGLGGFFVDSFDGERLITVSFDNSGIKHGEVYYIGNTAIYCGFGGELYSVQNPGPDPAKNNSIRLDDAGTRALLKEPEKYGLSGVTIDPKKRIFLDGVLQTREYKTFYEYWKGKTGSASLKKPGASFDYDAEIFYKNTTPELAGYDSAGNIYWASGDALLVFATTGYLLDIFAPIDSLAYKKTAYAIHPSGDAYFLGYDTSGVYIYRVKNVWDPKMRAVWYKEHGGDMAGTPVVPKVYAMVESNNLRVRESPNLSGKHLGMMQFGWRVEILERSAEKMAVDGMLAYWYKIKTEEGLVGWSYGYYLRIED